MDQIRLCSNLPDFRWREAQLIRIIYIIRCDMHAVLPMARVVSSAIPAAPAT